MDCEGKRPVLNANGIHLLLDRVEKDVEKGNFYSLMWFLFSFTHMFFIFVLKKPKS
jgi:hypothetical protein